MNENLKHNVFRGLAGPVAPTSTLAPPVFKVGDKVNLNFGPAGKLGPGRVTAVLQFESEDGYEFTGYSVAVDIHNDREMEFGYFDATFIEKV